MASVPESYYAGFQSRGLDELLGFFTPDGTDSSSTKRKATVDKWSSNKIPSATFKNEPTSGFRIVDTARRGGRSNNVLFRVIHPIVGAEFEITAENLNDLHQLCIIEYGEIKTELLLIRNGNNNELVVKDGTAHKKALQDMVNAEKKKVAIASISKKDVKVLDTVSMGSGDTEYVYLGHSVFSLFQKTATRHGYSSGSSCYLDNYLLHNQFEKYHLFVSTRSDGTFYVKAIKTFPKITKLVQSNKHFTSIDEFYNKDISAIYQGNTDYYYNISHFKLELQNDSDFECYYEVQKYNTSYNEITKLRHEHHLNIHVEYNGTVYLAENWYMSFLDVRHSIILEGCKISTTRVNNFKIKETDSVNLVSTNLRKK